MEQVVNVRGLHGRDLLANGHPTAQHEQGALVFFCCPHYLIMNIELTNIY